MPIVYACIWPASPPPDATRTADALQRIATELLGYRPETVVLVASPASTASGKIGVFIGRELSFGSDAPLRYENDLELSDRMREESAEDGVPVAPLRHWDATCADALSGLSDALADARVVAVAVARLAPRFHFDFGRAGARAIEAIERRVALICFVGLAAAAGPGSSHGQFDQHYRRAIASWDVKALVNMDPGFRDRAGEHAVAQTALLMGALSGYRIQPRELAYESSEGPAHLVIAIDVLGRRKSHAGR